MYNVSKDRDLVCGELLPRLEGEHGLSSRVHARDFASNQTIVANILTAIESSRKVYRTKPFVVK